MISFTLLGLIILVVAATRIGWGVTALIAAAAVSVGFIGNATAAGRDMLTMVDQAVMGAVSNTSVSGAIAALVGG